MKITIHIGDLAYELFPGADGDKEKLRSALTEYYTVGTVEPIVTIKGDIATIELDIDKVEEEQELEKLVRLCERRKFDEALKLSKVLLEKYPTVSEFSRLQGQVYAEKGNHEEAIDSLIEALRWDPENDAALILMGNIYSSHKNDVATAKIYYEQVLKNDPGNKVAMNNIAVNLFKQKNLKEAKAYFEKVLEIDEDYPNGYIGLAMMAEEDGDPTKAFNLYLKGVEKAVVDIRTRNEASRRAFGAAEKVILEQKDKRFVDEKLEQLGKLTPTPIVIEEDKTIPTAAKIEYAENYSRDHHLVKYRKDAAGYAHLIVHELVHLELAEEARKIGENRLFTSNDALRNKYLYTMQKFSDKLKRNGVAENAINKYLLALYDGINSQIFNTPIDLFIEDRIYHWKEEFRPIQYISLIALVNQGVEATTREDIVANAPKGILSKSKILNLVNALHLKSLYYVDMLANFKATKSEMQEAEELYKEFEEYRDDKEPGEEYELIQNWAEDLGLERYFELIPENQRHKPKTADNVLEEIEKDPYDLESVDPKRQRKMQQFLESHSEGETNMAVAMYMVDALQYFKEMGKEDIKKIALEIATLGMNGIDPKKDGYHIPSIKGSSFSGYKTLAYYYVSWAMGVPEMLASLQMPFDEEYELAVKMTKL